MDKKNIEEPFSTDQLEEELYQLKKEGRGAFKFLIGLYKGQTKVLSLSIIALIMQRSPVWIIPIITSNIINIATDKNVSPSGILVNVGIGILFVAQNVYTNYLFVSIYAKIIRHIEWTLRGMMVRKMQRLSIMFHKEMQSGRLQSKIMRDVENVELFLKQVLRQIFFAVLDISVAVAVTASKSPIVLPFFLIMVPLASLSIMLFKKSMRTRNSDYRKAMEQTQSRIAEMLTLIPMTRAHGLQSVEIDRVDSQLNHIKSKGYKLDKLNAIFTASSWAGFHTFQLICLSFTAYLAYKGTITIGEVILYQTYFTMFVGQMNNIINMFPIMTKSLESVYSISEIVGEMDEEVNNKIVDIEEMKGDVEFRHVSFRYKEDSPEVLKDFSMKVAAGESIAFVGDSGSGKSTILNLLISFMKPEHGDILIDGIHMNNLDLDSYRRQLAVVPQDTLLFSGSIRDNVAYGLPEILDKDIEKVIADVGLDEMVDQMPNGIYSYLEEGAANLSGGQRQRLSIARALLRKPKIIVFDEATSALDSKSEQLVQAATEEMMQHCTAFMVAHRLSTIRNADRIIVIEDGRIVEEGDFDTLMANKGKFYQLKVLQA